MCNTLKICMMLVMLLIGLQIVAREQSYILTSPDGKLVSHIVASSDDELSYDIAIDGVQILKRSRLTLNRVYGTTTTDRLPVKKITRRSVDEMVKSPFYRQAEMRNHYNELTLQTKDGLWVDFRAYDEGLAYRYRTDQACTVKNELVEYNFAADWQATVPYVRGFDEKNPTGQYFNSFENIYTTDTLSQLDPRRLAFLPLVVHADNGVQVCLTESHQEYFPGLYLKGTGISGQLRGDQAPCP
ncbi:MAG: glycoside hydrolase family 97 N-terminal domain-containing protein, partial [Bacteroidales bacterium]|nr:glycoside hydrolase family 97 N-terminal domain-containing protein [Bacteroidales bacterium]